ncbi:MAG: MarR family transcriptional regulator [Clostridiales bacterium]|nr:MarR family transcriptional regulator [Clostridiales bacterium]
MQNDLASLQKLLRVFDRMHHKCLRTEFQTRGLNEASHPSILMSLKHEIPGMCATQIEIARRIGIAPPTVAISIKRMEKAGLIKKIGDADDLRRNKITLTEKGYKLLTDCEEAVSGIDEQIFRNFSEKERELLQNFYIRMIGNLEAMGVVPPEQFKTVKQKTNNLASRQPESGNRI